jgi:mRNA interferase RelE/StbE
LSKYKIFETDQFLEEMKANFRGQGSRIREKLTAYVYPQLKENPHFGKNIKKLKNYHPETWRYRIGRYRFFYKIDDCEGIVFMIAADDRKDSY